VIRAVIFDFDGVIANSEPLHFAAIRGVLADEGVTLTEEEYYAQYLGYDDAGVFRTVSRDRGLAWTIDVVAELAARKAVSLDRLEQERSILFPGAEQAIRRLAATLPLAIASGALRAEILGVLDHAGLSQYFGAVVAAEDTLEGKPAPDPYLRAVSLLGTAIGEPLRPGECVAVEDSHWGLESARAAGLRTIAITHTYPAAALGAAELVIGNLDALTVATVRRFDQA
jgi:HAD superfamily hydrolase (TIGR01509 family)